MSRQWMISGRLGTSIGSTSAVVASRTGAVCMGSVCAWCWSRAISTRAWASAITAWALSWAIAISVRSWAWAFSRAMWICALAWISAASIWASAFALTASTSAWALMRAARTRSVSRRWWSQLRDPQARHQLARAIVPATSIAIVSQSVIVVRRVICSPLYGMLCGKVGLVRPFPAAPGVSAPGVFILLPPVNDSNDLFCHKSLLTLLSMLHV